MFLSPTRGELASRMEQPQRHRLLHGYPLPRLMATVEPAEQKPATSEGKEGLLVGVLPHTFCNPKVRGCGFCTFPHEAFNKALMERTTAAVVREIETRSERQPQVLDRTVSGLYFGGGGRTSPRRGNSATFAGLFNITFDSARQKSRWRACRATS